MAANQRNTSSKPATILIVDDEEMVRSVLSRFLSMRGYHVLQAEHGKQALELASVSSPDMVISDIQMPCMDGFQLLRRIKDEYPQAKRILMTGYDIDTYLQMIREHNIGNILPKGTDFGFDEIGGYVDRLLQGDIFGLGRVFPPELIRRGTVRRQADSGEVCAAITRDYGESDSVLLEIAINELISNAVFHGVLNMTEWSRDQWKSDYQLTREQAVTVTWARDREKIGVAVEDPSGNLRKVDVLRWMDHPIDETCSEDEHGRGLMLVRRLIDRFIINIDPSRKTECILLQYLDRNRRSHQKPLLIHEL